MADNLITRVGLALYGENWQAQMARELGVHKSTVQDWRQGRNEPRQGVFGDLLEILLARIEELDNLKDELKNKAVSNSQM